ncbi:hypothetical protein [Deinococcus sp. Leaf326]|uniref:hypothetical protein n=1 Tax=Deinococcus sp. Leaf326 TaxID=1736338 RepID=UPI000AA23E23|nr:hypothetical protein [Deinococcus sp. Leaf326]
MDVVKQTSGGRISSLSLLVLKDHLKPSEIDLLTSGTNRVATSCFNLSAGRLEGITV